jgi:hypothetical protein
MRSEPGTRRRRIHVLCITVTVLGVYLAALAAGFLALDDADTIRFVQSGKVVVSDLFFSGGIGYYRPLSTLSLLTDFHLFGGNPAGYHLTNILLHLTNALLVYHLASVFIREESRTYFYPFLAGLLFAVHPVNSEAVVWMCARPDLLCCFFFLLSFIAMISVIRRSTPAGSACIFVAFLCSLMSKEASLFLVVLAPAWLYLERKEVPLRNALAACVPLFLAALVYFLLRKGFPVAPGPAATSTLPAGAHPLSFIMDGSAAYGFYLRKLVYPFPLNIAITEISTGICIGAFLLGLALSVLVWVKNAALRVPICFLALSLTPPIGAMFLSLPWTPYAERYLYLPSVAFSLCTAFFLAAYAGRIPRPVLVICILLLAIPTVCRVVLWTKPVPFWQDAVAKSPRFGTVRLLLSASYLQEGRLREAEESLQDALRLGLPRKNARDFSVEIAQLLKEKTGAKPGVFSPKENDRGRGVYGNSPQTPKSIPQPEP